MGEPLDRSRLPASVTVRDEVGSTNAELLATPDAPHLTVLVAEHQTAGRGRLDRTWVAAPYAALTFSVLLRPAPVPPARWGWVPLLAGVALADAVGPPAVLKWPNDLLLDGRKAAGILAQATAGALVVGIGLNVDPDGLPDGAAGVGPIDRTDLLVHILDRLQHRWSEWYDAAGDAVACGLAAAYADRCDTVGREVRVSLPDGTTLTGTADAVDTDGRLVVAGRALSVGDVVHVRPLV